MPSRNPAASADQATRRKAFFGLGSGALALAFPLWALRPSHAFAATSFAVVKPDSEWKRLLAPQAYQVLRHADTEAPFSSPLDKEKRAGIYRCAGCAQSLFSSGRKFDSGTGWPSFWQPMSKAVTEKGPSHPMLGTEVLCSRCGGQLGHVFNDGPQPTGLRYCINGAALDFKAV
ncbi:MAG: peptide-methionine (R)-S-oxide reductase MsrB [Pseudomonadota bacterium]